MKLILFDKQGQREFTFDKDAVSIGRSPDNDLVIRDSSASRHHCQIQRSEEGKFYLIDLGSCNGTLVNGTLVKKALLSPGDKIQIGLVSLFFEKATASDLEETTKLFALGTEEEEIQKFHHWNFLLEKISLCANASFKDLAHLFAELLSAERVLLFTKEKEETRLLLGQGFSEKRLSLLKGKKWKNLCFSSPVLSQKAEEEKALSQILPRKELKGRSALLVPFSSSFPFHLLYLDRKESFFSYHLEFLLSLSALLEKLYPKERKTCSTRKKPLVLVKKSSPSFRYDYSAIVTQSPRMYEIFHILDQVTDSDVPVLIQGESGTGKELIARALHFNSKRKNHPFVSENCSAIPETLLESEFFGYEKGAFTGADQDKPGLFEIANGGTLFLDEISEMNLDMQAKLLRVLQEGEIRRVGGKKTIRVDVRLISACNRDLAEEVQKKRFRGDLFYRINVITIELPPLRERKEDIPLLVEHFLQRGAKKIGRKKRISQRALEYLMEYDWPGNVRELENEIERAMVLAEDVITPDVLSPSILALRHGS